MIDKSIYMTHEELCELFDIPKESGIMTDEYSIIYRPDAEMWKLTIKVGTKEEIQAMCE